MKAVEPDLAGTVFQPQGKRSDSRRAAEFVVGAPCASGIDLPYNAARGEFAARFLCSTIQTKFHVVPTKGGLLSNSQDAQPRLNPQRGSRPQTAETQSSLFYKSGGNK